MDWQGPAHDRVFALEMPPRAPLLSKPNSAWIRDAHHCHGEEEDIHKDKRKKKKKALGLFAQISFKALNGRVRASAFYFIMSLSRVEISASQKDKQKHSSELYYVQQSVHCFPDLMGCLCLVSVSQSNILIWLTPVQTHISPSTTYHTGL